MRLREAERLDRLDQLVADWEEEPSVPRRAAVGHLLARSETSDVVDALLVFLASRGGEPVSTGDVDDITHLRDSNNFDFEVIAWP